MPPRQLRVLIVCDYRRLCRASYAKVIESRPNVRLTGRDARLGERPAGTHTSPPAVAPWHFFFFFVKVAYAGPRLIEVCRSEVAHGISQQGRAQ